MRIVIHLGDYDPDDEEIVHHAHCVENPEAAADDRAVLHGFDTEWYPGGGNIHLVDGSQFDEVAELLSGAVQIEAADGGLERIQNASLVSVQTY